MHFHICLGVCVSLAYTYRHIHMLQEAAAVEGEKMTLKNRDPIYMSQSFYSFDRMLNESDKMPE